MTTTGYAIVLMLCAKGAPCEMVAIRPVPYKDVTQCKLEAVGALRNWRRVPAEGAQLEAVCKSVDELCRPVSMDDEPPGITRVRLENRGRFAPSKVAERISSAMRLLCAPQPKGGCGQ